MTLSITFDTAVISRPGGREENQDACAYRVIGDTHVWTLADGLGGHLGGALAAQTAVAAACDAGSAVLDPAPAFDAANRAVLAAQQAQSEFASMRTTLVLLLSDGSSAAWGHCGDSRLYHFRGGQIIHQTRDHSVPQSLVQAGEISPEQIRFHEDRNRLLRSLGAKPDPGATLAAPQSIQAGDAFLLASDGFWEWITEPELCQQLATAPDAAGWLQRLESLLVARAASDHDNYSAVAVLAQAIESRSNA